MVTRRDKVLWFALMDRLLSTPEEERIDWVAKFEKNAAKSREMWENARERLFPNAPKPEKNGMLPPSLREYEGIYEHPAYQKIALAMVNRTLHADVLERTFLDFDNVNYNHFLVRVSPWKQSPSALLERNKVFQGELRIEAHSKVVEMGLAYEPSMGNELVTFFVQIKKN